MRLSLRKLCLWILHPILVCVVVILFGLRNRVCDELPRAHVELAETGTRLWLFNTFWLPDRTNSHHHEVELAFLLNVANDAIDTVYFAFERTHGTYGCKHLLTHLSGLMHTYAVQKTANVDCTAYARQPTYLDMFHLALAKVTSKDIAIIANADMVFDSSARIIHELQINQAAVLATSGLYKAPRFIRDFYGNDFDLAGIDVNSVAPDRCYAPPTERTSWDAFIFHPADIHIADHTFVDEATGAPFFMNQHGAENAALHAIMSSTGGLTTIQACDFIKMWHLHTTPKMHYNNSDEFVTAPAAAPAYGFDAHCHSFSRCESGLVDTNSTL